MTRSLSFFCARVIAALSLSTFLIVAGPGIAHADMNCDDFSDQAAAQQHLDQNRSDPDRLDADHDGVACESNVRRSIRWWGVGVAVVGLLLAFGAPRSRDDHRTPDEVRATKGLAEWWVDGSFMWIGCYMTFLGVIFAIGSMF